LCPIAFSVPFLLPTGRAEPSVWLGEMVKLGRWCSAIRRLALVLDAVATVWDISPRRAFCAQPGNTLRFAALI
jgi:hypothetical protein